MRPRPHGLGPYTIQHRLAFGGMAEVFLATLERAHGFRKPVVLKRLLPHLAADARLAAMFIDEARLAARLVHPHIVAAVDFGSSPEGPFLVLEYVDGSDLATLLERAAVAQRPLSVADVGSLGLAVAQALAYAHGLAVVHRDVSPHNILIDRQGWVRLTDFGVAQASAPRGHSTAGALKGKLGYMAPEQARGERVDGRADQFALGLVVWEALVGAPAYQAPTEAMLLSQVATGAVATVRALRPDVPPALAALLERALAPAPADRFPTMEALVQAFEDAGAQAQPLRALAALMPAPRPATQVLLPHDAVVPAPRPAPRWRLGVAVLLGLLLRAGPGPRAMSGAVATPVASPAAAGRLSLRTLGPWVDVYVGLHKLGTTPLEGAVLPAGRQAVRLVNLTAGVDRTEWIDVPADAEVRRTIVLQGGS